MKTVDVASLDHPGLSPYAHLTEAQLRNRLHPDEGLFICESEKVIRVALQAGVEPVSFLAEERCLPQVERLLGDSAADGVPVYTGPRELLARLTGYELSRGVLCCMRRPAQPTAAGLLASLASAGPEARRRVAVMHSVVNSTNTGAIFRAATALGVDALLLTPTCCDPLNRRACRVSMGTVFQLPWAWLPSVAQLRQEGWATVALALNDRAVDIHDPALKSHDRLAIVMGTEGDGLPDEVLRQCDHVARIPMRRGVDSLNVAAAASVAFYELC